jgi:hypothetical protein
MRARISPASRSENFDRQRDSFSAPDTQAGDAASSSVALQGVNQRGDNPCTMMRRCIGGFGAHRSQAACPTPCSRQSGFSHLHTNVDKVNGVWDTLIRRKL